MLPTPAEVATRLVAAVLDAAERRGKAMSVLSECVVAAAAELDPDHERNGTDWADLPQWVQLPAYERLRSAYDRLLRLETEAAAVIVDLRGLLARAPVGSQLRPIGLSPVRAQAMLAAMADLRDEIIGSLFLAERSVRPQLEAGTSAALRKALRVLAQEEHLTREHHVRLVELMHMADVADVAGS